MTSVTEFEIPPLSADVVPFVADKSVQCLATVLEAAELKAVPGSVPAQVAGIVRLKVVENISGAPPGAGESIGVRAHQIVDQAVRVRNGADHWNDLNLTPGTPWIVMCTLDAPTGTRVARAILETGKGAPAAVAIADLKACYELERHRLDREAMLRALAGESELRFRYALDALAVRQIVGRPDSAALIERAAAAGSFDATRKVEMATLALRSGLFAARHGADAANVTMLSMLAAGVVRTSDPALLTRWVRLLAAAGLTELSEDSHRDMALRNQLLGDVRSPEPALVIAALDAHAARLSGTEKETVRTLAAAWRKAH